MARTGQVRGCGTPGRRGAAGSWGPEWHHRARREEETKASLARPRSRLSLRSTCLSSPPEPNLDSSSQPRRGHSVTQSHPPASSLLPVPARVFFFLSVFPSLPPTWVYRARSGWHSFFHPRSFSLWLPIYKVLRSQGVEPELGARGRTWLGDIPENNTSSTPTGVQVIIAGSACPQGLCTYSSSSKNILLLSAPIQPLLLQYSLHKGIRMWVPNLLDKHNPEALMHIKVLPQVVHRCVQASPRTHR